MDLDLKNRGLCNALLFILFMEALPYGTTQIKSFLTVLTKTQENACVDMFKRYFPVTKDLT
jgi:hypothetical protein